MKKTLIIVAVVLIALVTTFFAFNAYIYDEKQADLSDFTLGEYAYRCGDGTEFTIQPSSDMSRIRIIPATSVEYIGETIISQIGTSTRYEGDGLTFVGAGETVTLSGERFTTTCTPITNLDEAPFNWGEPR